MMTAADYRLIKPLGKATRRKFNSVHLAENLLTGELCVVKSLTKASGNEHLQERLRLEAGFDFSMNGLPRTIGLTENEQEIILVKSYEPGEPVTDFLKSLRAKHKAAKLLEILKALRPLMDHLKANNILHLDLKPGNILVAESNGRISVSIIDFGLSARMGVPERRATLFPLGYAAPELIMNRLHLADHRTDIFSLGIVLWQCFTGVMPLLHPNPSVTTNLQLTHPLPSHDDVPARYLEIIGKMSHKYVFGKPPNHYSPEVMDELLKQGMEGRVDDLSEVIKDWEKALEKKSWFRFFRK